MSKNYKNSELDFVSEDEKITNQRIDGLSGVFLFAKRRMWNNNTEYVWMMRIRKQNGTRQKIYLYQRNV